MTKRAEDKKPVVKLKRSSYQPSKAELEEEIKLDIPGETLEERVNHIAKAVLQPVKVEYED